MGLRDAGMGLMSAPLPFTVTYSNIFKIKPYIAGGEVHSSELKIAFQ